MKQILFASILVFLSQGICQVPRQLRAQMGPGSARSLDNQTFKKFETESSNKLKSGNFKKYLLSGETEDLPKQKALKSPTIRSQVNGLKDGGVDAGGGGGHTVSCKGSQPVALDFFNASLASGAKLLDPNKINVEQVFFERLLRASEVNLETNPKPKNREVGLLPYQYQRDSISIDRKRISDLLKEILAALGPVDSWPDRDLKFIEDHKIIYNLPANCVLEQAAAQYEDEGGSETKFYQNSKVVKNLSSGQKDILRLHEGLYYIVRSYLGTSSRPVRALLETFLLESPSDEILISSLNSFMQALLNLGGKFVCETMVYRNVFKDSMEIPLIHSSAALKVYGRTKKEAAAKINDFYWPLYKFCAKVVPRTSFSSTCEELSTVKNSCYENK